MLGQPLFCLLAGRRFDRYDTGVSKKDIDLMRILFVLAATAALLTFAPVKANAQTYPWCAIASEAVSCLHFTFEQCMATVRGQAGFCKENPLYPDGNKRAVSRNQKK